MPFTVEHEILGKLTSVFPAMLIHVWLQNKLSAIHFGMRTVFLYQGPGIQ